MANPDNPAVDRVGQLATRPLTSKRRIHTGTYLEVGLKTGDASKTAHGKEAEEDLGGVEYNGGFRNDHL